jgi:hypothetical protein
MLVALEFEHLETPFRRKMRQEIFAIGHRFSDHDQKNESSHEMKSEQVRNTFRTLHKIGGMKRAMKA